MAVVGREIVERWRREEGWVVLMGMLRQCGRVDVKARVREGDVWEGGMEGVVGWLAGGGGGNVFPGPALGMKRGDLIPVGDRGRGGWVQKLLEDGVRGKGVKLEFCWV